MKILTLTLCPAFDIHCEAEELALYHENIASVTDNDAGGKGVNISRALTNFGVENTALVVIGEENGDSFASALMRDGISFLPIKDKGRIRENITIHTKDGKETRLSFKGTDASDDLLQRVERVTDDICDADTVLTLTGRLPVGVGIEETKAFVKRLAAKGVRVVIDSRSFNLRDLIEAKPFLIKPNEEEIAAYMGREIKDEGDALLAAEELRAKGIENVMISLGSAGAVLSSAEGSFFVRAPRIKAISTVGAGDSSIAGFLMALLEGCGMEDCLKRAVAFGSAACLTAGTRPPKPEDVQEILCK